MIENYDALIFDMDGTLVDSGKVHESAWIATLNKYRIPVDRGLMRSLSGMTTQRTLQALIEHFNVITATTIDDMSVYKQLFVRAGISQHVKPTRLKALAQRYYCKLPMSVGTGASTKEAEAMLHHCGMRHLFAHVVGAEDVCQPKPSPDTFLKCAELMNVKASTCIVFEDAELGMQAAHAAGMHAIDVLAAYGIENNYFI